VRRACKKPWTAAREEVTYLILDGKVIESDRLTESVISRKGHEIDAWYSGKTHRFGGNVQALMDPRGVPRWVSDGLPGHVNGLAPARELVLAILWAYTGNTPVRADGGYTDAGCGVLTPVPRRSDGLPLHADQRTYTTNGCKDFAASGNAASPSSSTAGKPSST